MIINSKKDFDAASKEDQQKLKTVLSAGVNQWSWVKGKWVLVQYTRDIEAYGLTVADFDDLPTPEKPTHNPDNDQAILANKERITELQAELSKTDFKFSQDYDKKDTPEWLQLKSDRQAWRDEIRQLEQSL